MVPMIVFFGIMLSLMISFVVYACYVIAVVFVLWMAIDAGKQDRFWWMTLIVGVPVVGAVVYYFTEKKHEYAHVPSHHIHTSETEEQHEQAPKPHHHHLANKGDGHHESGQA